MEYRSLGRTGVQVSPLCMGCMNFGWGLDQASSSRIIHAAIDARINFLDVANVYGGHKGESEEVVGKALEGRRDQLFLATKVHGKMGDAQNEWGNHRFPITRQCQDGRRVERWAKPSLPYPPAMRRIAPPPENGTDRPLPNPPAAAGHPDR